MSWRSHWASSRSSVKLLLDRVMSAAARTRSYDGPAHHQLIGNHSGGVVHYVKEAVDVLGLSTLPRAVCGVGWCGVIVGGSERMELLQEPVIRVDLRSPYPV